MTDNTVRVNLGTGVDSGAAAVLRGVPGMEVATGETAGPPGNAEVCYASSRVPVTIAYWARVSSAAAHQIARRGPAGEDAAMIVAASEMTAEARAVLTAAGVGAVDGAGNAELSLPGLIMRVSGRRQAARATGPTRLSGRSGLVAQALLLDPARGWKVTELAQVCGVSAGLAHRVLERLENEGMLAVSGSGPGKTRRVADPAGLLDLWDEEQSDRPTRTKAFMLAQTPGQLTAAVCAGLDRCGARHALTGAAAAARVAPLLTNVLVVEAWLANSADPARGMRAGRSGVGRFGAQCGAAARARRQRSGVHAARGWRSYGEHLPDVCRSGPRPAPRGRVARSSAAQRHRVLTGPPRVRIA